MVSVTAKLSFEASVPAASSLSLVSLSSTAAEVLEWGRGRDEVNTVVDG